MYTNLSALQAELRKRGPSTVLALQQPAPAPEPASSSDASAATQQLVNTQPGLATQQQADSGADSRAADNGPAAAPTPAGCKRRGRPPRAAGAVQQGGIKKPAAAAPVASSGAATCTRRQTRAAAA